MPIVIKEVIVRTTVEKKSPQWSEQSEDIAKAVKEEVLAELAVANAPENPVRKGQKDR